MTPKEKAKDLVRKYWDLGGIDVLEAKQYALIAVEEVLSIRYLLKKETYFYKEVKKEIQNL